jgi:hypothetical protein
MVALVLDTAASQGDLSEMNMEDVLPGGVPAFAVSLPKPPRTLALSEATRVLLRRYGEARGVNTRKDTPLFPSRKGSHKYGRKTQGRLSRWRIRLVFQEIARRQDLPVDGLFTSLQRTACLKIIEDAGWDASRGARLTGHVSGDSLLRFAMPQDPMEFHAHSGRRICPRGGKRFRHVYLVQEGESNIYKVGISERPRVNLIGLQRGNSQKLNLVFFWSLPYSDAKQVEDRLKEVLSPSHKHGEWYSLTIAQVEWIKKTQPNPSHDFGPLKKYGKKPFAKGHVRHRAPCNGSHTVGFAEEQLELPLPLMAPMGSAA